MSQSKYWCFTVNNYTIYEIEEIKSIECTYLVFGQEIGSGNETPHLQGYIEFETRKRLSQVKQLIPRAHIEKRRSTAEKAADYCKKQDPEPFEKGSISQTKKGKRTDLDRAIESIKEGATVRDLWHKHPKTMVRNSRGLIEARRQLQPEKPRKVYDLESFTWNLRLEPGRSYLLWGEPGIGKTCYVKAMFPNALWVSHIDDLGRFDPSIHEGIIFDDMSFTHLPRQAQIHLVDTQDDRSIHIRYGTACIPAGTTKIFTSNVREIFDLADKAISRRVKVEHLLGIGYNENNNQTNQ